MSGRLPLSIEPMPGEWWRSYLVRVADCYGVHPFALVRRLYDTDTATRRHLRWTGIALSEQAAERVGAIVNLCPSQVGAMHLSAYDGSVLDFGGKPSSAFDPIAAGPLDRLTLEIVGPLVTSTTDRFCPICIEASPSYRASSWRLLVHLVCTTHQVLLTTAGPKSFPPIAASGADTTRQRVVLERLHPSPANALFFEHLAEQLLFSVGGRWGKLARQVNERPEAALDVVLLAVDRVRSPGYPDYQGLSEWSTLTAAKYLQAPQPLILDAPTRHFPHLLPMHVYGGGLSDLLHRAPVRLSRALASVGAVMAATGRDLHSAATHLPDRRRIVAESNFLRHLIQLEREGRAERFWDLCGDAARQLIRDAVDYRVRERVCRDEDKYRACVAAEPSAYPRTIRTWLVDQWACTYTSSNVRPSVRDGSIESFDRRFGPGMRAALERLVDVGAA